MLVKKKTMLRINEESKSKFIQDKEYVLSYLQSKGVKDEYYLALIRENDFGCLEENLMCVDKIDKLNGGYLIEAFLTYSPGGHDIQEVNCNLEWAANDIGEKIGPGFAIASIAGDDVICMNPETGEVYLWFVGTREFQKKHVANSVKEFVKMINYV